MARGPLRVRVLGRVDYRDALALQHGLFRHGEEDYLLLLEHPHVYTQGVRGRPEHVLVAPGELGAEVLRVDRGGDVTYHGPGQLVGYPICSVPPGKDMVPRYVHAVEGLVIAALSDLGLEDVGRVDGLPGVWVAPGSDAPRKICAIGVRISRGRSMHGFALNVEPDLEMFRRIVPCGLRGRPVTSLRQENIAASVSDVVDALVARAGEALSFSGKEREIDRQDERRGARRDDVVVADRSLDRRMLRAGVSIDEALPLSARKPDWLRAEMKMGTEFLGLRRTMRSLKLVTVCEEAGCPNIFECWRDGTATFMINGERCTRACGFCLVDTAHPLPLDAAEPARVAEAVADMGLSHAVVTAVARDDLADGGAAAFAATIEAVREKCPATTIEVLIPDLRGDETALRTVFEARPDVLNHNLETVLRLQRAVRPSASYARSLAVLARAKAAGLVTKSGIILGMGEADEEVEAAMADLAGVGVDILTLGQYLRPSSSHIPVARYVSPEQFAELGRLGREMGFRHVEASPLTRSSYHARQAIKACVDEEVSA